MGNGTQYAPDLMEEEAIRYISENMRGPFFLFFTTTVPHLALQVQDDSLREYMSRWDDPPYDGRKSCFPHDNPRLAYQNHPLRYRVAAGPKAIKIYAAWRR